MATTSTTYTPHDPMRICDVCGDLQRKSQMRRLPGNVWACSNEPGWRTAVELDRANARQKPFRIRPVKNAKPETWSSPDSYEGDEGEILNFLARSIASGARYENVTGGDPAPLGVSVLETYGWAAQYLYSLIVENKRPLKWITQAKAMLATIAAGLRARQVGFGLSASSTRANDAFYGAFLESGATSYVTNDVASCGLAMLYAYRVLGTLAYRDSARAAASYLRNVQAIGSHGTHYTSSDAAGTARLYTGAVASEVSTQSGVFSSSAFYPGDLLTLQFWKALQATDGDQSLGATAVVTGFGSAPAQMLSQSLLDMRYFWANGTRDSAGETYTGLSATTPREFFNAYPAVKAPFSLTGTGRWEYSDGAAAVGTQVTSQNFAGALSALFAYEGASTQVAEVSDWLRTFTSNPAFETGDNVSISALARAETGDFVATNAPTDVLTVRDADADYAAVKMNGSALYDWGAFGLLSTVWGSRNLSSFIEARKFPLGRNQRFYDGQRGDGDHFDWITLRGRCGLSAQTAFFDGIDHAVNARTLTLGSPGVPSSPSMVTGAFWFEADSGAQLSGGSVVKWFDKTDNHNDVMPQGGAFQPTYVASGINSLPSFQGGFDVSLSNITATPLAVGAPRVVIAVVRPTAPGGCFVGGGAVVAFGSTAEPVKGFDCFLGLEACGPLTGSQFVQNNVSHHLGTPLLAVTPVNYTTQDVLCVWSYDGATVSFSINGVSIPLQSTTPGVDDGGVGFVLMNTPHQSFSYFTGLVSTIVCHAQASAPSESIIYAAVKYGINMTIDVEAPYQLNDAVRAAQFATAFRIAPVEPMQV